MNSRGNMCQRSFILKIFGGFERKYNELGQWQFHAKIQRKVLIKILDC